MAIVLSKSNKGLNLIFVFTFFLYNLNAAIDTESKMKYLFKGKKDDIVCNKTTNSAICKKADITIAYTSIIIEKEKSLLDFKRILARPMVNGAEVSRPEGKVENIFLNKKKWIKSKHVSAVYPEWHTYFYGTILGNQQMLISVSCKNEVNCLEYVKKIENINRKEAWW